MSNERVVWFNGNMVPEKDAKISIYDSALMFGDVVFEMTRSFNKKQFKLREHLERLYSGLKILRIPINITINQMEKHVQEVVEANDHLFQDDDEHRIMIDVTRGLLSIYEGIEGIQTGTNVVIADFPLRWTVSSMGHLFDSGINCIIPSQRTIPASLLDPKIKNRNRIHYLMANIEVSGCAGKDNWALLLDPDGYITEGTGDNFFIIKDRQIISPEGRNILRGISRDYIFELCKELQLDWIEKNIEPYDVYNADEAFITGTPFCMLPVTTLNGIKIKDGLPGQIFNQLLQKWSKNVDLDIKGQIQKYQSEIDGDTSDAASPYRFKRK